MSPPGLGEQMVASSRAMPRVHLKTTTTSVFVPAVSHNCVLPLQETST